MFNKIVAKEYESKSFNLRNWVRKKIIISYKGLMVDA
jgi:hypothetical protein